jgi:hypothetical protein
MIFRYLASLRFSLIEAKDVAVLQRRIGDDLRKTLALLGYRESTDDEQESGMRRTHRDESAQQDKNH